MNLVSRIQELAEPGGCLICDATRHLVEWLAELSFEGQHKINGVAKSQLLWKLLSTRERATRFDASLAQGRSAYVGRDGELAVISCALRRAKDAVNVVDVVAEPGLGKTCLVFEFLERSKTEAVSILTGHCSSDGQQVPFFPLLEVARSSFRVRDNDHSTDVAEKLEAGLRRSRLYSHENLGLLLNFFGLQPPEGSLDRFDGVLIVLRTRDLFPALLKERCRAGLIVLRTEDIHWIDIASKDLLRKLIESGEQLNFLVVHTRRPEYLPDWRERPGVTSLALKLPGEDDIRPLAHRRLAV